MTAVPSQLGRPVGANGEETRWRILVAAMRCVAEVGYSQASIRAIAGAAGMTSGSLYHYFSNKSELLKATVSEIEAMALPRLRDAALGDGDVVDRLDAVLDASDELMREYPYLAAFERAIRAEAAAYLRGGDPELVGFRALRDIIADIVEDAQRQGSLGGDADVVGTVDAIYALARGLTEQAANLSPDAYHAALRAAKLLIRGTLFDHGHQSRGARHR